MPRLCGDASIRLIDIATTRRRVHPNGHTSEISNSKTERSPLFLCLRARSKAGTRNADSKRSTNLDRPLQSAGSRKRSNSRGDQVRVQKESFKTSPRYFYRTYLRWILCSHDFITDKAPPGGRTAANKKFQEIAFAYAVLSDERRRRRYDATGNTSESLDLEDDDFNWVDFYREQFSAMVDGSAIDALKAEYQNSAKETHDLLEAFEKHKGDMDKVYRTVMLSNVLDDDKRFRAIINKAILECEVTDWPKFTEEPKEKREKRVRVAKREAEQAKELAKELGLEDKLYGKGRKRKTKKAAESEGDLMALIQQRRKNHATNFLDNLEAKWAANEVKGTKRKSAAHTEPPEEAFERNRAKTTKKQKAG